MIVLSEVASKIEELINGENGLGLSYYFKVETQGFHIDHIIDRKKNTNFIPVFISSMGGEYNPVPKLKQSNASIPIVFYFPVRFKDDFYRLNDFLADLFVGQIINYGTLTKNAISNISVPRYGEIQTLDFKEFKEWVSEYYQETIDKSEPYMSMEFTLFLSNAATGYVYGNNITVSLSTTINGTQYSVSDLQFDDGSILSNSQAQSEQEEGTNESIGIPFSTAYGASFKIYPKLAHDLTVSDTGYASAQAEVDFYKAILKEWLQGRSQTLSFNLTAQIGNDSDLKFERVCFLQSVNFPIAKGQILSLTISMARKIEDEEEQEEEQNG